MCIWEDYIRTTPRTLYFWEDRKEENPCISRYAQLLQAPPTFPSKNDKCQCTGVPANAENTALAILLGRPGFRFNVPGILISRRNRGIDNMIIVI